MADLNTLVTIVTPPKDDDAVAGWLAEQASKTRPFLLAYADDGVIWGRWVEGALRISHDLVPNISPPLRGTTLQQAFVFGPNDEVRLFREELGTWKACRVVDADEPDDKIVETQMLWGNKVITELDYGFTHVWDRVQRGLDQALPIVVTDKEITAGRLPRLQVHHFIEYDEDSGEARIGLSRLVTVGVCADGEEVV